MSAETRSIDELQAFMEKYQAKDIEEAARLYNTVPVLREMALALGNLMQVITVLALPPQSAQDAEETANLVRIFAVTLYLIGYRAGQEQSDSEVGDGLV